MTDGRDAPRPCRGRRIVAVALLLVAHAAPTAALAGLVWVVQLVVYPGFRRSARHRPGRRFHDAHTAAMALAVAVPWAVQGVTLRRRCCCAGRTGCRCARPARRRCSALATVASPWSVGAAARPAAGVRRRARPPAARDQLAAYRGLDGRNASARPRSSSWRRVMRRSYGRTRGCPAYPDARPARPRRRPARPRGRRPVPLARGRRLGRDAAPGRPRRTRWRAQHLAGAARAGAAAAPADALLAAGVGRRTRLARRPAVLDPPRARVRSTRVLRDPRAATARERVLLDPAALDPTGATTLDAWAPSQGGPRAGLPAVHAAATRSRCCACSTSTPAPRSTVRSTAAATPPSPGCPAARRSSTCAGCRPTRVPAGEEQFHRRVWRHVVGTDPSTGRHGLGRGPGPDELLRLLGLAGRPLAAGHARAPGPPRATTSGCSTSRPAAARSRCRSASTRAARRGSRATAGCGC